ncbi:hypothetical protein Kpol_1037p45 [Vanderwaltozyma polyspora DSM 70294]|uniref:Galactose-1-phosphate uridylyltransferase n=1 Tax=Vanderwaltozyma polyspora (strain ATCC 22028 / DSM 70294 / BCRC 21397 / CBS 2163 / NBRC 10782 / NRRL Y-8283 / UCD 57-17) TaxID=436907 RepID=A7TJY6_VANPO|nr:uncharacterized protein Kpol_1037p45 [Vanderwaltozyma polyspora DSM 70294]EDO17448.1 hypothetical protein Kpol_1037p45 [Vanderwaltozyma polyspora DSM 70294]
MTTAKFDYTDNSHRRYNPLTDSWVLVSPHRAKRPWLGQQETVGKPNIPEYDVNCYLCPGNKRATGNSTPAYESTYIFQNDYPAVKLEQPDIDETDETDEIKKRLFKVQSVKGNCFVICFSPKHNLTIPQMKVDELVGVVNAWQSLYNTLDQERKEGNPYKFLQIFENKGTAMGCSNLHPHGQAWCLDVVPSEVSQEFKSFGKYQKDNGCHLLSDYVQLELKEKVRVVLENDTFIVTVPYWAVWPFETIIVSKERIPAIVDFNEKQNKDLATIIKQLTTKYDNLFQTSFPYSMGIHQQPFNPTNEEKEMSWFHMHFYPPLLRSATVRKFLVGFEMLGEPQRDLTAEQAAERLRNLDSEVHYLEKL